MGWGVEIEPVGARGRALGELDGVRFEETASGSEHGALAAAGWTKDYGPRSGEMKVCAQVKRTQAGIDAQSVMWL